VKVFMSDLDGELGVSIDWIFSSVVGSVEEGCISAADTGRRPVGGGWARSGSGGTCTAAERGTAMNVFMSRSR
jgi:hypothetical protein